MKSDRVKTGQGQLVCRRSPCQLLGGDEWSEASWAHATSFDSLQPVPIGVAAVS